MDRSLWWWFMSFLIGSSFVGIQTHRLSSLIEYRNESTNEKQTSKTSSHDNSKQFQSISSGNLAEITSTIRSNPALQSLITKPNSYLYDPNEDEEIFLERVKRDSPPFVCKSKHF